MKLRDWATIWSQNNYINIKDRSCDVYEYYMKFHILKRLGHLQVEDISQDTLQTYVLSLAKGEKTFATNTIAESFRILKGCLSDYYERYNLKPIKFKNIKVPMTREKRIKCFTESEQRKIENKLNLLRHPKQIGILLTLYTGLRLGELLALTWEDVDLKKNLIYVGKTLYYRKSEIVVSTPKTSASIRTIPIPLFLQSMLREHKKRTKSEYLITNKYGKPIIPRTYQYEFSSLLKHAKVEHRGFHSLRHTFATRAIECGMDVKSLSEILGHANPTITLKRYAHSMLDYKKAMMNKIGKLYGR